MSQSLLQALAPLLGANGVVNFIFAKTESGYSLVVMPDESIGKSLPELANGVTICGDVEAIEAKIPELAAYSARVMSTFDTLAQAEAESKAALAAEMLNEHRHHLPSEAYVETRHAHFARHSWKVRGRIEKDLRQALP